MTPPPDAWRTAWLRALADLEADVDAAELFLHRDDVAAPEPWVPPQLHGPLPQDLLPRAQQLLERQLDTARRIAERAVLTGRHALLADRLRSPAPAARSVYVDLQA